jgi:hypothetical protein
VATLGATGDAEACDCNGQRPHFLVPNGSSLPSNARAIGYVGDGYVPTYGGCKDAGAREDDAKDFRIDDVAGDGPREVGHTITWMTEERPGHWHRCAALRLVVASEPLVIGHRYRFTGPKASVEVVIADQALRSAKAELAVKPLGTGEVKEAMGMSCSNTKTAFRHSVSLGLSDEARRFEHALLFTTRVDGQVWRPAEEMCKQVNIGESWRGAASEMLYGGCNERDRIDGNRSHEAMMEAVLPGTDVRIESVPVTIPPFCTQKVKEEIRGEADPEVENRGCGRCAASLRGSVSMPAASAGVGGLLLLLARMRRRRARRTAGSW